MVLGMAGFDVLYHDTYYVVGHFHLVLSMGGFAVIFAVFFHYWFYFFRVGYNKFLAVLQAVLFFIGELVTFILHFFWECQECLEELTTTLYISQVDIVCHLWATAL